MMKISVLFLSLAAACMACAEVLPFKTPCFDTKRGADKAKSSLSMEQKEACVGVKLEDGEEKLLDYIVSFANDPRQEQLQQSCCF